MQTLCVALRQQLNCVKALAGSAMRFTYFKRCLYITLWHNRIAF